MKYFTIFSLTLLLLLFSTIKAVAADLTVICNSSKCPLSSNEPLFSPTTVWVPEKKVAKTIEVKNTSGAVIQLFFEIRPDQITPIADYMFIDFKDSSQVSLWSGLLSELYEQQIIQVTTLNNNQSYVFSVEATLQENAPNFIQGNSTTFDFSFSTTNSSDPQNNYNDQNTTSPSSNTNSSIETSGTSSIEQFPNQPSTPASFVAGLNDLSQIELLDSVENDIELPVSLGEPASVLGTINETTECKINPFWWLVLALQAVVLLLTSNLRHHTRKLSAMFVFSVLSAASLYFLVCNPLIVLTALIPFLMILFILNRGFLLQFAKFKA